MYNERHFQCQPCPSDILQQQASLLRCDDAQSSGIRKSASTFKVSQRKQDMFKVPPETVLHHKPVQILPCLQTENLTPGMSILRQNSSSVFSR